MHSVRTGIILAIIFWVCAVFPVSAAEKVIPVGDWKPSPTGAAIRSLVFPGWGQAYNRSPVKAVIYGGVQQALIYSIYRQHKQFQYYDRRDDDIEAAFYKDDRNRLTWYLAGATILSVMDAFVDAHLYGFEVSDDLSFRDKKTNGFLGTGIILNISWRFN